jgi:hypothetical protein
MDRLARGQAALFRLLSAIKRAQAVGFVDSTVQPGVYFPRPLPELPFVSSPADLATPFSLYFGHSSRSDNVMLPTRHSV